MRGMNIKCKTEWVCWELGELDVSHRLSVMRAVNSRDVVIRTMINPAMFSRN